MISAGPRTQRARYSIKSSIPSSAQWMSSSAITSGRCRLAASTKERIAENRRSRICCGSSTSCTPVAIACSAGGSMPSGSAIVAAIRAGGSSVSASETTDSTPLRSFVQATSESSVSTSSNWSRRISPSAQ
jgi:hypothetical protein